MADLGNGQLIKNVLRAIQEQGKQRHKEVLDLLRAINEQGEQRHREVVDLLIKMDERTVKIPKRQRGLSRKEDK